MSVLEHILPLLFCCPCLVILTPQIPAVRAPFPAHVLTPPCGVLSCFPPPFGRSGISYPCNLRKVMRRLFWEWCFLSSLYCSLEDANFHFSCGRNLFQSFCLELHSRRFVSMARSRPGAGWSPGWQHHLSWVLQPSSESAAVFSKRSVMLQLLLSTSVFTVVAEIIKDTLCVLCLTWRKGNWSCMFSSVFCSSHLVFNFELPKREQSMGIPFGFLTA